MAALLWLASSAALLAPANATVWPSSHQRIVEALASDDVGVRRNAAARLMVLPPKLARGLARAALRDGDVEVRLYGARAAAALAVEGAGDEVVDWLQDSDMRLRVAACELIEASPTAGSVQSLARVLGDAHTAVRRAAASAMGASGLADAVSPLLGHLDDGASEVRLEVVRALGRIGDLRAVVPLVSKLQDQDDEVRREAARALGQLGDPRATATLMLALQDKSVGVRTQALDALGRLKAAAATTAIAALLEPGAGDTDPSGGPVRDAALKALGQIGSSDAVSMLLQALEREGPVPLDSPRPAPVREALAAAGAGAVATLRTTLAGSPSRRLASGAALALARLEAADAVEDIIRATQRGTVALDAGLSALGALGDGRALSFVLEHIDEPDARVRQLVVQVATKLLDPERRDGRAVDVVRDRVLDPTTSVGERIALVRLLGKTGAERARELLLSLARSKPIRLRVAVVEALGTLASGSAEVEDALLEALGDQEPLLRVAASTALASVGADGAARKLLHRLEVAAEQDRGAIGVALSGALGRSRDASLVEQVRTTLATAPAVARDALIEGLGRMDTPEAASLLGEMRTRASVDDRRKVAEALGRHPRGAKALAPMVSDPDPTVRANAAWSLGKVGSVAALSSLLPLLQDQDVAVAGNAAVALGRVASRQSGSPPAVTEALCSAASDYRAYVRAGALTGLRFSKAGCPGALVRNLLKRDPSWRARQAAAALLRDRLGGRSGSEAELDRRALWRCAVEDRDASVAARCGRDDRPPQTSHEVLVYVVPDGNTTPVARAPFALALADGSLRLGVADRRGAVFEGQAPDGFIELAVPAALAQ